jgi:hypothetical protein
MSRKILLLIVALFSCIAISSFVVQADNLSSPDEISNDSNAKTAASFAKLSISFMENLGQVDPEVRFMVKSSKSAIFFAPFRVVFAMSSPNNSTSAVQIAFKGANSSNVTGQGRLEGTANFFIGNDKSRWIEGIATYGAIKYDELYPGIDLIFRGAGSRLKHDLIVQPGADISAVRFAFSGQDSLSLDANGSLLIATSGGIIKDEAPVAYQESNGAREPIEAAYRIVNDSEVEFVVGRHNQSLPIVIDPSLFCSTYLGGSGVDLLGGIAVDDEGCAYLGGTTISNDFPIKGPFQHQNAGMEDVIVSKINTEGTALVWSTYLGGSQYDGCSGIAIDSQGFIYIAGGTVSDDFPVVNPIQPGLNGSSDAFIAKLNSEGSAILYSTYLGGENTDEASSLAVDGMGCAYVTGSTYSLGFPTVKPIQPNWGMFYDAFVTKINAEGSALDYSTYLGGSGYDYGRDIAVDRFGSAYVVGDTSSDDFPAKNAMHGELSGDRDAFVCVINPVGEAFQYSSYLGGQGDDFGRGIAVDAEGCAYIVGHTRSDDFPLASPLQQELAGGEDVFLSKINEVGSLLMYSTYIGGSLDDQGYSVAVDGSGCAVLTGNTYSEDFPIVSAIQKTYAGGIDAIFCKVIPDGSAFMCSSFLGGSSTDEGYAIAVDPNGIVLLAGNSRSPDFPLKGPIQNDLAGEYDIFLCGITEKTVHKRDTLGLFNQYSRNFLLDIDGDGTVDKTVTFGRSGDQPVAGDWDGDEIDGIGFLRPLQKKFYLDNDLDGVADKVVSLGGVGDLPVSGDWDGDGVDGIGYLRPLQKKFFLDNNCDGTVDRTVSFGRFSDKPVCGDWDADGIDTWGVFRPIDNTFRLDVDGDGTEDIAFSMGQSGDRPVAGDWDADGSFGAGTFTTPDRLFRLCNGLDGIVDMTMSLERKNGLPISGCWI